MVRKCRAVAKIAVMDDVVPPNSANKRKITAQTDFQLISTTTTTSFVKLRSRRRRLLLPENSLPTPPAEPTLRQPKTKSADQDRSSSCASPTSDDIDVSTCCCSSNGCSEVVEEESVLKFIDLEDEKDEHGVAYKSSREIRRETTPSSQFRSTQSGDDMETPAAISEATSCNRSLSSSGKVMPAESDLEEFFITAEKNIQKRFTEKYNYDIVEDIPLEGRYEWIRLKP